MSYEIPIDIAYPGHRKVVDLKRRLKDPEADIWPLRLWFWAATNARDGVITVLPATLEVALGWRGAPLKLFRALKGAGWINRDGKTIHDWMDGIGRAIYLYECKKQKARERYLSEKGFLNSSGRNPPIREGDPGYPGDPGRKGGRPPSGKSSDNNGSGPDAGAGLPDLAPIIVRLDELAVIGSNRQKLQHARGWAKAEGVEQVLNKLTENADTIGGRDILYVNDALFRPAKAGATRGDSPF